MVFEERRLRVAVVGHVEHVTIARVRALPAAGEIVHLEGARAVPGGGGGIAFYQLTRSPAEVHLFTALGDDDAGAEVGRWLETTGATIHPARRAARHTRDLVLITPDGDRTIFVVGEPLHPRHDDDLPWQLLATCDAVYFTGEDPETVRDARAAKLLVVAARRRAALLRSTVRADAVVGSARDPREASALSDYLLAPRALVMTEGAKGGYIETGDGRLRFEAPTVAATGGSSYGAGDSFAAALTWYLARGLGIDDACRRAAAHGAAVLRGDDPIETQLALE